MTADFTGPGIRLAVFKLRGRTRSFDEEGGWTGSEPVAMVAMWNKSAAWIPFTDALSSSPMEVDLHRIWMSAASWKTHEDKKKEKKKGGPKLSATDWFYTCAFSWLKLLKSFFFLF